MPTSKHFPDMPPPSAASSSSSSSSAVAGPSGTSSSRTAERRTGAGLSPPVMYSIGHPQTQQNSAAPSSRQSPAQNDYHRPQSHSPAPVPTNSNLSTRTTQGKRSRARGSRARSAGTSKSQDDAASESGGSTYRSRSSPIDEDDDEEEDEEEDDDDDDDEDEEEEEEGIEPEVEEAPIDWTNFDINGFLQSLSTGSIPMDFGDTAETTSQSQQRTPRQQPITQLQSSSSDVVAWPLASSQNRPIRPTSSQPSAIEPSSHFPAASSSSHYAQQHQQQVQTPLPSLPPQSHPSAPDFQPAIEILTKILGEGQDVPKEVLTSIVQSIAPSLGYQPPTPSQDLETDSLVPFLRQMIAKQSQPNMVQTDWSGSSSGMQSQLSAAPFSVNAWSAQNDGQGQPSFTQPPQQAQQQFQQYPSLQQHAQPSAMTAPSPFRWLPNSTPLEDDDEDDEVNDPSYMPFDFDLSSVAGNGATSNGMNQQALEEEISKFLNSPFNAGPSPIGSNHATPANDTGGRGSGVSLALGGHKQGNSGLRAASTSERAETSSSAAARQYDLEDANSRANKRLRASRSIEEPSHRYGHELVDRTASSAIRSRHDRKEGREVADSGPRSSHLPRPRSPPARQTRQSPSPTPSALSPSPSPNKTTTMATSNRGRKKKYTDPMSAYAARKESNRLSQQLFRDRRRAQNEQRSLLGLPPVPGTVRTVGKMVGMEEYLRLEEEVEEMRLRLERREDEMDQIRRENFDLKVELEVLKRMLAGGNRTVSAQASNNSVASRRDRRAGGHGGRRSMSASDDDDGGGEGVEGGQYDRAPSYHYQSGSRYPSRQVVDGVGDFSNGQDREASSGRSRGRPRREMDYRHR